MSEQPLSQERVNELRVVCQEVAKRVVAMLNEQVAAHAIDYEAAEDFVIWADDKLQEIDALSVEQMVQVEGHRSEGWRGYVDAAVTGRGFIRGQAGDSQEQSYIDRCRDMEWVQRMATLFNESTS